MQLVKKSLGSSVTVQTVGMYQCKDRLLKSLEKRMQRVNLKIIKVLQLSQMKEEHLISNMTHQVTLLTGIQE